MAEENNLENELDEAPEASQELTVPDDAGENLDDNLDADLDAIEQSDNTDVTETDNQSSNKVLAQLQKVQQLVASSRRNQIIFGVVALAIVGLFFIFKETLKESVASPGLSQPESPTFDSSS